MSNAAAAGRGSKRLPKVLIGGGILLILLCLWFGAASYLKESAKDPGLGLRGLHERGITGAGVNVAVIDGKLRLDHEEYKDRIRHYEELADLSGLPLELEVHPPAMVSLLAGKQIGVAPKVDVYYFGLNLNVSLTPQEMGKAIRRVIAYNETLPAGKKIRLLSMSMGFPPGDPAPFEQAMDEAWQAGILVLQSVVPTRTMPPLAIRTIGCPPWRDRNKPANYGLSPILRRFAVKDAGSVSAFLLGRAARDRERGYVTLYVPADYRTVAGPGNSRNYVYNREGGDSSCTPYATGVLALALQVNPDLDPAAMVSLLARGVYDLPNGVRLIAPAKIVALAKG